MSKNAILIIEPSEIVAEGLRNILSPEPDINLLSPIHDANNLESRIATLAPDVMLINPTVQGCATRRELADIRLARPSMPVLAIVYQYVERDLLEAYDAVIDIRCHRGDVVRIIRDQLKKEKAADNVKERQDDYELSERETDVLILVAQGLSSKEIADRLHISIHTVNSHRKNITRKTNIKSVAGLAMYAMLHNLT